MRIALQHLEYLHGKAGENPFYGFSQMRYSQPWQQKSGCGPTAAANILYYHLRSGRLGESDKPLPVQPSALMELTWRYIRPSALGVHSPALFANGMRALIEDYGLPLVCQEMGVPWKLTRFEEEKALSFLESSLKLDSPLAMLNLINRKEQSLDTWHWVSVTALERTSAGAALTLYDGWQKFSLLLPQWLNGRRLGGGFVKVVPRL